MYSFEEFLQEISIGSGIKFNLISDDGRKLFISCDEKEKTEGKFANVLLGREHGKLFIPDQYASCTSLLKYVIESRYKEIFSDRQLVINDIFEGKEVAADRIDTSLKFIENGAFLFLVNLENSRYEALNIIRQSYNEEDVISLIYGDNIVIIGNFDEVEEHAKSIGESIVNDLYLKYCISYSEKFYDSNGLKNAYETAKETLMLRKKFDIRGNIFSYNKLLFEKIVYNIKEDVKKQIFDKFKDKFNSFDNEMIITIEEFINCDLNISDAARKLYIHRNTLIYRLDKINKETGFDIRNFREAAVFIIAFLIWKESYKVY